MSLGPFDPRSICNLMLDDGDRIGAEVSNLALQKLLYFAHARHLIETGTPLVAGYFEAWQYGPVHPTAYKAFKSAGNKPITFRAEKLDPLTGVKSELPAPTGPSILRLISRTMSTFGTLAPGRLVELSHARGAPWDFVVGEARSSMAFGLRISDNIIIERFKHHKVSLRPELATGAPSEDTPFA